MDTKSLIIDSATKLFRKKGYKNVGLNELLKTCNVTKGALYHHFPKGKEELLMACLQASNEAINEEMKDLFEHYRTTEEATQVMLEKLITDFEKEGTLTGHTFISMISEMTCLSESIRSVCKNNYHNIQLVYQNKLIADGYSQESAHSIAIMMIVTIEGGIMMCLTQNSSHPLQVIAQELSNVLRSYSVSPC